MVSVEDSFNPLQVLWILKLRAYVLVIFKHYQLWIVFKQLATMDFLFFEAHKWLWMNFGILRMTNRWLSWCWPKESRPLKVESAGELSTRDHLWINDYRQFLICSELTIIVYLGHCVPGLVLQIKSKKRYIGLDFNPELLIYRDGFYLLHRWG